MIKQVMAYISYLVGILGFAGVVWTYATKSAGKDYDIASLKEDMVRIKTEMVTKYELKVLTDSIRLYNYRIEQKTNTLIRSNNNLRNSYVTLVKSTVKDRDFFIELMNGIEWVVSPIEDKRTDSIDFKIKISKKQ